MAIPSADNGAQATVTINIVSSITVLSGYNSAVIWILPRLIWKLDLIAIKIRSPTARYKWTIYTQRDKQNMVNIDNVDSNRALSTTSQR